MSEYEGPNEIGFMHWPGRGTTYDFKVSEVPIEIYVTEKRKKMRVFVDGKEWKADA